MNTNPSSLAAAARAAAEAGGSIKVGDRVMNPSGARMQIARPYLGQQAQEAPSQEGLSAVVLELVQAQARIAMAQAEAMPGMVAKVVQAAIEAASPARREQSIWDAPVPPQQPMRPIRFLIERNRDGDPTTMSVEYGPGAPTRKPQLYALKAKNGLVSEVIPDYEQIA